MTIRLHNYRVTIEARYHVPRRNVRVARDRMLPETPVLLATLAAASAVLVHVLCVVAS